MTDRHDRKRSILLHNYLHEPEHFSNSWSKFPAFYGIRKFVTLLRFVHARDIW